MWLIGRRCKCSNVLSWPILIGRGLDQNNPRISQIYVQFWGCRDIPLTILSGDCQGGTPVPIPNTEVKPLNVDDTWWETARESNYRKVIQLLSKVMKTGFFFVVTYRHTLYCRKFPSWKNTFFKAFDITNLDNISIVGYWVFLCHFSDNTY